MQKVVNGVVVHYMVVGRGKRNLLILHGWKGSIDDWMFVAQKLGERYRVILVDLPGFGMSDKPQQDWGIYEYGEFTGRFLDQLGIKKISVLGHSFGGRIALLLASRNPQVVERLVLVDAAGMEVKNVKSQVIKLIKPLTFWLPQQVKNRFGSRDYQEAGEMRKTFVKVVNQPLRNELTNIKAPALIIWGERDKELPFLEAKMLHKGIKNSVLRIVWGASHWPHREKPDDFMRVLTEEGV